MRGGDRAVSQPVWNPNKLTLLSGDHYCSAHKQPSRKSFSPKARDFIREHIFYHSLQSDKQMAVCVKYPDGSHSATCDSHS